MADSAFPIANDVMTKAILRSWMQDGGVGDYIQSGFVPSDGGDLNVSVSAGVALMQGLRVSTTDALTGALSASTTNHVFLTVDETVGDDVILSINTTGTAPSGKPSLKLCQIVTGASSITSITREKGRSVQSNVHDAYVRASRRLAGEWEMLFPMRVSNSSFTEGAGFIQSDSTTAGRSGSFGLTTNVAALNSSATDMTDGDIVAAVCCIKANSAAWTNLSANQLHVAAGFAATGADFTDNGTGERRVVIGVNSSGVVRVITCNGTAVTNTTTGFTLVSDRKTRVEVYFTKGTNAIVRVSDGIQADTETTVTATLPSRVVMGFLGKGTTGNAQSLILFPGVVYIKTV